MPLCWLGLSPPLSAPYRAGPRTKARLSELNNALKAHLASKKTMPLDLNELRLFALEERRPFQVYDAYGQRFDYLRLDQRHYLLRSFGEDGVQNTPQSAPDMGVISWGPRPKRNLSYRPPADAPGVAPHLFPAALLAGAESLDGQWLARLYVDKDAAKRHLIARHRERTGLIMVAPHDAVEEFFWLPDGQGLIYSATGSQRHRDGLFHWDLATDRVKSLLDEEMLKGIADETHLNPATTGSALWLSLAGMTQSKEPNAVKIYVYVAKRPGGALDPQTFFAPAHLLTLELKGQTARSLKPTETLPSLLEHPLLLSSHLHGSTSAKSQQAWLDLPFSGDLEKALLAWHTYSERETEGPLLPYSLWVLSALYGEAFALMTPQNARDADVLRTFGTEIALALLNSAAAPTYIKGLAQHAYENLLAGKPLPYRFANLTIPPSPELGPALAPVGP